MEIATLLAAAILPAAAATAAAKPAPDRCAALARATPVAPTDARLRYRFMGTSTLLFEDGETQILIDGFFSRPKRARAAIWWVRPNCARIEKGLRRSGVNRAQLKAIFVAHAHVDHVLDSPSIALMSDAEVVGSEGVRNVVLGHGLAPARIKQGRSGVTCGYGKFRITPIETDHSSPNIAKGKVTGPVPLYAWAQRYRAEESLAFLIQHGRHSLLVYPSTASRAGALSGRFADIVFLGISGLGRPLSGREFADRYWAQVVGTVGARTVYPIHWDDLGTPLSRDLRPMPWPLDNVQKGKRHLTRLAGKTVTVGTLPLFDPVAAPDPPDGPGGVAAAGPPPPACPAFEG